MILTLALNDDEANFIKTKKKKKKESDSCVENISQRY